MCIYNVVLVLAQTTIVLHSTTNLPSVHTHYRKPKHLHNGRGEGGATQHEMAVRHGRRSRGHSSTERHRNGRVFLRERATYAMGRSNEFAGQNPTPRAVFYTAPNTQNHRQMRTPWAEVIITPSLTINMCHTAAQEYGRTIGHKFFCTPQIF